ncbi:avirulence protein 1b [Phytophthora sojae]|uniref:RxLR effector protein n=2 Tax=Phytophthora sojae TaxID=67593 RepID=G4YJL7_PHYSP|nr:avirulence protein 1b [Phytophthora sojae]ABZ10805.1 Avh4 [Phytophthora sojae]AEK80450.1 Avh4 [Phytophthora sojae]AEK80451.1 Avh4 [Phytophthora sojae]EGZ30129.1 avirulence protein 1b [Phytophthora sojae]|eukprot:XP_009517404.1 avirulence protein 1b [Phytophthora sojae]
MRLSLILSVIVVTGCLVACNAAADSAQTKISVMRSEGPIRSLNAGEDDGDASYGRFLRAHKENDVSSSEERVIVLTEMLNKANVKQAAKAILKDPSIEAAVCKEWNAKGFKTNKISLWLSTRKKDKYLQIYNGYGHYLYQLMKKAQEKLS